MSSSLSAVFAVGQARGALHLRKKVATQGNGGKEGCSVERPRPKEERKEQPQNRFPPERAEAGRGGVAGTMPL